MTNGQWSQLSAKKVPIFCRKSAIPMSEEEDFGEEVIIGDDDDPEFEIDEGDFPEPVAAAAPVAKPEDNLTGELLARFNPKTPAARRLIADLREVMSVKPEEIGFHTQPLNNNLFTWEVRLFGFDKKDPFYKDLMVYKKKTGRDYVEMQVTFPETYPSHPPFIRVVQPRFQFHTGRVTVGGSICTDVLTMDGWGPCYAIQSLLINIFAEIQMGKPRIDFDQSAPYSVEEARAAFRRVASDHHWKVPPGF
jgi:ubiquitin-conjugating enzyme E2 Q